MDLSSLIPADPFSLFFSATSPASLPWPLAQNPIRLVRMVNEIGELSRASSPVTTYRMSPYKMNHS